MIKDFLENPQSVMIVKSKGKETRYAQMLFQLLSKLPDFESSQPITESEYKASFTTIDKIPIIFFGNGKEAKLQEKAVDWQYDRFGMRYGWMGNRCVITADANKILSSEQSEFADYYNSKIAEFCSSMQDIYLSEIEYPNVKFSDINEIHNKKPERSSKVVAKIKKGPANILKDFKSLFVSGINTIKATPQNIKALCKRKDIWKHQYELLVCEFMINGLTRFMTNSNKKISNNQAIIVYDIKDSEYAYLLHNLIHQYSECDVAEYTEKMFKDNEKILSSKNKIIFLGTTKSSKERWLDIYRYSFNAYGMQYGRNGNQAFISTRNLEKAEREEFIKFYNQKREQFKNKAKTYKENKDNKGGIKAAAGWNILQGILSPFMLFSLPGLVIYAERSAIALGIGKAADKIMDYKKTVNDLKGYQYQLLLREFVFNEFEKFMEA